MTFDYCLYLLKENLGLNPLWIPIVHTKPLLESKQFRRGNQEDGEEIILEFVAENLNELGKSQKSLKEEKPKKVECMFSLMQIIAIHALQTADETILMFIYDLSLLRSTLGFLEQASLKSKMNLGKLYDESHV